MQPVWSLVLVLFVAGASMSPIWANDNVAGAPPFARQETMSESLDLLGHVDLGENLRFGDVYYFDHGPAGRFAYVGTFANFEARRPCGHGVKIFDVSRPRSPRLVATARSTRTADYEDVVVGHVGKRTVLAVGFQPCATRPHGLALFDVTDPRKPQKLAFFETPPHGVHELDMAVRADGRVLVVATVPHSEREGTGGDVRIIEITRPRHPVEVSNWGIVADSSLTVVGGDYEITHQDQGIGAYASNLAHGVRAVDDGMTLYVSHWDAGVVKLDISDPAHPRLIGRTMFEIDEDGDAHSAVTYEVDGTSYILQNNEEISPLSPPVVTSSATGATRIPAMETHFMPTPLSSIGRVAAEVFDANDGCEREDFVGAEGQIVMFDSPASEPPCSLGGQVVRALRAEPAGLLINFVADYRPTFFRLEMRGPRVQQRISELGDQIPAAMFSSVDGAAIAIRSELARGPVTVRLEPTEPSLGFLEVFSETETADVKGIPVYQQVGEFSDLPHVVGDPTFRAAWYTIHNTEVMDQRAYSSWYGHGIVAMHISNPEQPRFVGRFRRRLEGPAEMWGVAVDRDRGLVFGSDIRTGLWVLKPS